MHFFSFLFSLSSLFYFFLTSRNQETPSRSFYDRYFAGEIEVTEDGEIHDPLEDGVDERENTELSVSTSDKKERSSHKREKKEKEEGGGEKTKKSALTEAEQKYKEKVKEKEDKERDKKRKHSQLMRVRKMMIDSTLSIFSFLSFCKHFKNFSCTCLIF
jgi:flagellar motility protein MotE (MotC chaperone)